GIHIGTCNDGLVCPLAKTSITYALPSYARNAAKTNQKRIAIKFNTFCIIGGNNLTNTSTLICSWRRTAKLAPIHICQICRYCASSDPHVNEDTIKYLDVDWTNIIISIIAIVRTKMNSSILLSNSSLTFIFLFSSLLSYIILSKIEFNQILNIQFDFLY